MFALAFALRDTLTSENDVERRAFLALVRALAAERGRPYDEGRATAVAAALFPPGEADARPDELARAVNDVLADDLPASYVIGRFRVVGDTAVREHVRPLDDVPLVLERVASLGVPAAVICNGWGRIAQRKAAAAGFTGRVLVSEELGAALPSPQAFAALAAALVLPPDRVWFVTRDAALADTASANGLHALALSDLNDLIPPLCEEYTRSLLSLRYLARTALKFRDGYSFPPPPEPKT
jgi:FMN phosphatase YigB (HAD superfamily)